METQASEGQACSRISGEMFSPCEAEREFGAAGVFACPSLSKGQAMYMVERQNVPPKALESKLQQHMGRMDVLSMETWFLEIPSSLQPLSPHPSLIPIQLLMVQLNGTAEMIWGKKLLKEIISCIYLYHLSQKCHRLPQNSTTVIPPLR